MLGRIIRIWLCCIVSLWAQTLSYADKTILSILQSKYYTYKIHSNTLFSRLGELRGQKLQNGVWINDGFGFLARREMEGVLQADEAYNDFAVGIDTYLPAPFAKVYFGGYVDVVAGGIKSGLYNGDRQSYGLGGYVTYFNENQFFVDLYAKFFYATGQYFYNFATPQKSDSLNSANLVLGVGIGQRFSLGFNTLQSFMFFEPTLSVQSGYLSEESLKLSNNSIGVLKSRAPLALNLNLAIGQEFNEGFMGDVKAGISFGYDRTLGGAVILGEQNYLVENDFRVGLFVEADFVLNDNFRFFFHSHSTSLGKFNVDYVANLGVRMIFGTLSKDGLNSRKNIDWNLEKLQ